MKTLITALVLAGLCASPALAASVRIQCISKARTICTPDAGCKAQDGPAKVWNLELDTARKTGTVSACLIGDCERDAVSVHTDPGGRIGTWYPSANETFIVSSDQKQYARTFATAAGPASTAVVEFGTCDALPPKDASAEDLFR